MTKIATKWKLILAIAAALTLAAAALCTVLFLSPDVQAEPSNDTTAPTAPLPIKRHATAEVGNEITGQLFALEGGSAPTIVTQLTEAQMLTVGEYHVQLSLDGKTYEATLSLVDTTAPTGTGINAEVFVGSVPAPQNFVTDIQDLSEVTISADALDTSVPGTVDWKITLTDAYGNTGAVTVTLTVVPDTEAPKFNGLKKITIELGESVSYKSGVSVTDNCDGAITTYTIDKSTVDTTQPGTYIILYTAVDKAGNQVTAERTLIIEPKPVITKELVESVVAELIDRLTDDNMSVNKKFELAYNYIRKNVTYKNIVEEDLYTAAYYAIKKSRGDCYNYYACITVICDYLGIDNMGITRSASSKTPHYWSLVNLGTGWYHVDACPTILEYNKRCFMWTDKQCEDYNKSRTDGRTDYYAFDAELYPERATEKYKP